MRYFNGGKKLTNDMAKLVVLKKRKKELTAIFCTGRCQEDENNNAQV